MLRLNQARGRFTAEVDPRVRAFVESPWIVVLAPLVLFAREIAGLRLIAPNDAAQDYLPWHIVAARIWRSGRIPVWNPYVFSGSPLLAVGHAGVLYPPNVLFLVFPAVWANNAYVVLHFVIAGLGARALARKLYGDQAAAGVAGIAFGLTGFLFAHIGHQDILGAAAWLPWTIYGFEQLRERPSWTRLFGASAPLAMSFLAGHFQIFALNILVLGLYGGTVAILDAKRDRGRSVLWGFGVCLFALWIAAAQLLPTLHVIGDSVRSSFTYQAATSFSFPKSHVVLLLFPYLFGGFRAGPFPHHYAGMWNLFELSGYPGTATLVLAGLGLSRVWRDSRTTALLVAAVVCSVLALGGSTPAGRLLYLVPVFRNFRAWARYVLALDLAVAMLAARAVGIVRSRGGGEPRRYLGAWIAVACLIAAALVLPRMHQVRMFIPGGIPAVGALALPLVAAVSAALLVPRIRTSNIAVCALAVLIGLDLIFSLGWWHDWRTGGPSVHAFQQRVASRVTDWGTVPASSEGITRYLYASIDPVPVEPSFPDVTDAQGLYAANGNDELASKAYLDAVGKMMSYGGIKAPSKILSRRSHVLDLLRISVVLVDSRDKPRGAEAQLGPGLSVAGGRLRRYEYRPAIPEFSLVGSAAVLQRPAVLSALRGDRPFDPRHTVLLEQRCERCPSGAGLATGEVALRRRGPGELRLDIRTERNAVLLVSQAWSPGWTATVDGRPSPVLRADGLVQAIPVEAGRHDVRLRYAAPGLAVGVLLSAAALALVGFGIFLERWRRRR